MSRLESIEREVQQLDDESFAAFREWLMTDENARWDRPVVTGAIDGTADPLERPN